MPEQAPQANGNRLLSGIDPRSRKRLRLVPVTLGLGQVLYEPTRRMRDVYFPDGCLISLLVVLDRENGIEVGMVGREGMLGFPSGVAYPVSPVRALVQYAGGAWRTSVALLRSELARNPVLHRQLSRYAYVSTATAMQISGCNARHPTQARLARWLMMTRDRVPSLDLPLTQKLLAQMLGVQREGVTGAAGALRRRGLIKYSRGRLTILDARGLRGAACSCYRLIRKLESGQKSKTDR